MRRAIARSGPGTIFGSTECERGFDEVVKVPALPGLPFVDEQIRAAAIRAIDKTSEDHRPFFGWVFFVSPHEPYLAHYPGGPASTRKERYLQEVRYADEQIGLLMQRLRELGLWDRTIVIVLGDHGEEFGEHGGEYHADIHEECTHVPLVVRLPGADGGARDAPTSLTYLFAWLLRGFGGEAGHAAEQRITQDLAPLMARTGGAVVTERIWHERMRVRLVMGQEAMLFDFRSRVKNLYRLDTDPHEQTDLFTSDHTAAVAATERLHRYLEFRKARSRLVYVEGLR